MIQFLRNLSFALIVLFNTQQALYATWTSPPIQFASSTNKDLEPQIAADHEENAVAVWAEAVMDNSIINAAIYTNGAWGPVETISSTTGILNTPRVVMYANGSAVATWHVGFNGAIESAIYNGATWSLISTGISASDTGAFLATNGTGQAIMGWTETAQASIALFDGSNWGAPTLISSTDTVIPETAPAVCINASGKAGATWIITGDVTRSSTLSSGSWTLPQTLSTGNDNFEPTVQIDSQGHIIALWYSGSFPADTYTATFNGTYWSAPTILFDAIFLAFPALAVAPNGLAVALGLDNNSNVLAANYNGSQWSTPQIISTAPTGGVGSQLLGVAIDPSGDGYAVWTMNSGSTHEVLSSFFTNGTWSAPILVASSDVGVIRESVALSPYNLLFAIWQSVQIGYTGNIFTSQYPLISPPQSFSGKVVSVRFLTQTDLIHKLLWTPSISPNVVSYQITRNGQVIATVPNSAPYIYEDHNRNKKQDDVYTIVGLDSSGVQTPALTVTLQ
ncbi:MAG: hypothetical protein WCF65_01795 [Parachlamydiaceae bacterium]